MISSLQIGSTVYCSVTFLLSCSQQFEFQARMALTPKIKLLRVLSVLQTWMAVWLVVLGIVEHVRVVWLHSGVGFAIWTGVWVSKLQNLCTEC